MLNPIDGDTTVRSMVEAMLPRFSDPKLALHFGIEYNLRDYGYGEDGNTKERDDWSFSITVEMLFLRPNNYTKVYSRMLLGNEFVLSQEKSGIFNFMSDHDSCWSSDGFRQMFETRMMLRELYDNQTKEDFHKLKNHLSESNSFRLFSGNPKYLLIKNIEPIFKDAKEVQWGRASKAKIEMETVLKIKDAATLMGD